MYSFGWTKATGLGVATVLLMLASSMASAAEDTPGLERVEMDLVDYRFEPKSLLLVVGGTAELILTNQDAFTPHNFIIEAPEAGMEVKTDVPNGESVRVVLQPTRPGTYTFYCDEQFLFFENHREKGMEGKIEVTAASG